MPDIDGDLWRWYHNVSECYYHIQLTVKYRKALLNEVVQETIREAMEGFKERYAVEISLMGYDRDHVHVLCRFLPKYSGGQVIKVMKSISAKLVLMRVPGVKQELWGGEFWTDGYYIATVSGKGSKGVIEEYIRNQGRENDLKQLKLFE